MTNNDLYNFVFFKEVLIIYHGMDLLYFLKINADTKLNIGWIFFEKNIKKS